MAKCLQSYTALNFKLDAGNIIFFVVDFLRIWFYLLVNEVGIVCKSDYASKFLEGHQFSFNL